jgi:glycosyltransferase involved in cell wall biosynthesis
VEDLNHRIALVSGGIKLGGAATFLLNLGGALVRRSIPVQVISLEHENPYATDFGLLGIPLHVEDERRKIFEDRLSSALQVIHLFDATVVISCLGPSSYEILRYLPKSVMRLGMMQADSADMYPVFASYAPFFDAIVGVSRQIESNLCAHPVLGRLPVYYLPYGVPGAEEFRREIRKPGGAIRILYLGRLVRAQKRVDLFPQILRQLKASQVSFRWTLAGDGPERVFLEKEMASSPPDGVVEFLGTVSYNDVPALFASHDIFLLASDAEGLPLSLLEGMTHGLVPVVSNLPSGISEVVDNECGILVDPDNTDGYAAGIIWLARNPAALSAMSEKAPMRIRTEFSVAAMTDRWLAALDRIEKSERSEGLKVVKITGPIGHDSWWYREPMRTIRRLARRWGRTLPPGTP